MKLRVKATICIDDSTFKVEESLSDPTSHILWIDDDATIIFYNFASLASLAEKLSEYVEAQRLEDLDAASVGEPSAPWMEWVYPPERERLSA